MKYLLDTHLLSELVHAQPEDWVGSWFDVLSEDDICISVLTIGEIIRGIEQLEDPQQKQALQTWLDQDLLVRFHGQIIPVDTEIITEWGKLCARLDAQGRQLPMIDSLVAATARARSLVLITRDVKDFAGLDIEVSDPWHG